MTHTFTIATLAPSPSMNLDGVRFVGTYTEAVAAARESYLTTRRTTYVIIGAYATGYWYHKISDGIAIDRNSGSGIPETEVIA